MIAAIYARKSPDHNGATAEEARSVKRQIEHARAYAARKGWTVADEHVYTDDQITGAVFGDKRPGLAKLLNALTPRPPFQVLIMSEEQRLGRESIESGWTLKRILDAGVRVFFYLEDRERTLDTAMDKVMLSLVNFAGEVERERASQRTHDALLRRARAGHVANGTVFAYRNVPVFDGERRLYSKRVVVPDEATVVRRIFELSAAGWGYQRIAKTLNEDGAPAPSPRRPGRAASWSHTTVRDALFRETYRGRVVWNQRQHVIRNGVRKHVERPSSEWVTVDVPEVRIIDDALWTAAHERLAASRAVYLEQNGGRAWTPGTARRDATPNGIESPYLLTGFLSCGACGGPLFAHRHGHKNQLFFSYLCTRYHTRGRTACKNGLQANMLHADRAVLDAVERDVLRVEVLETALWKAMEMLRPRDDDAGAREAARIRDELAGLDAEVARLAGAIATGGDLPALLDALQDRERRRGRLRDQIHAVERERASAGRHGDVAGILDALRGHLTDWQGMIRQETGPARQALRALLAGRLAFTPEERDGERLYTFEGPGTVSPIIAGIVAGELPKAVASRPRSTRTS